MSEKFKEYSELNLPQVNKDVLQKWIEDDTFNQSVSTREGHKSFVFFEGPPSANGLPGIHHVMARTIKDSVCRYKTMQGYQVHRKAGWDTHGLPVELGVEKELGITKEDIGSRISVEEYNKACRSNVMKYTSQWENLTQSVGYWVDMNDPYITYDNKYIETLWYLLKELYKKGLLYKGYTIQPYSPAAGTGLSSHELNQPGCYRDVKDTTCTAQFKVVRNAKSEALFHDVDTDLYILAWTTTPWTLSSNTALCVGPKIQYVKVRTFNPYNGTPLTVILAKDRMAAYFHKDGGNADFAAYTPGDKVVPYKVLAEYSGPELVGVQYEQLQPWIKVDGKAFEVIPGDYVTTEDGTGIVHIAPTFGADDAFVAKKAGIVGLTVIDKNNKPSPLVDKKGRMFPIENMHDDFAKANVNAEAYQAFAGRYVKNAYDPTLTDKDETLDVSICMALKAENKAFKIEKHVHNYPHCWRTDKPILYYPLDSWFIKSTACKDRMIELNKTINWKPESTGSGRFGKWLENLNDWNLSRSRFWGTPLPIWRNDEGDEVCIGSIEELYNEIEKSVAAGYMKSNPYRDKGFVVGDYSKENYNKIDLHRPYVDDIILVSAAGRPMKRETDLIDVWFDSGAMPYAQIHYPFENKDTFNTVFPADFIAEGVDQTRGWFFTLHAIATMLFDSVAFKNVVSNGLVLDKNGNKMSKRLGNAIDPFKEIECKGTDPVRWYMITNSSPWDNLKYDSEGVEEVKRKFFGTLYNTYSFFALYANLDSFAMQEAPVPNDQRPEIDRWILSLLNTLVKNVTEQYENYEPTKAGRMIQDFVSDNLSNWYVRLSRKRFWKGEKNTDKISAYQTLYTCLETVSLLMAPIAPFFADQLFCDLNKVTKRFAVGSVHLATFPKADESVIDKALETRMEMAQTVSSMILALRRKVAIKVRQPLQKIIIPIINDEFEKNLKAVESIIKAEVNVKEIELLKDASQVLVKTIKPNFKALGPKCGKIMKEVAACITAFSNEEICEFEKSGAKTIVVGGQQIDLTLDDVTIISKDIPGWQVANEGNITVALDTTLTKELIAEGIAREFVNRIQNLRKDSGLDVTDKIILQIQKHEAINEAIETHKAYIASETLCTDIQLVDAISAENKKEVEIDAEVKTYMAIQKN